MHQTIEIHMILNSSAAFAVCQMHKRKQLNSFELFQIEIKIIYTMRIRELCNYQNTIQLYRALALGVCVRNIEYTFMVCTYVFHRIELRLYLRTCFGALIAPVVLALKDQ